MSKIISFVKLDFITIKPYLTWKNFLILLVVAVIMTWNSDSSAAAVGFIMVFAALYVSYPFAVGERNGIDSLYMTLSITRKTVVLGRYVFALSFNILSGILAFIISFGLFTVLGKAFNVLETLGAICAIFVIYTLIQAFQLPIFFKLGYAKAKFFSYLPLIGWPLAVFLLSSLLNETQMLGSLSGWMTWLSENTIAAVVIAAGIWLVAVLISYQISLAYYKKRDL